PSAETSRPERPRVLNFTINLPEIINEEEHLILALVHGDPSLRLKSGSAREDVPLDQNGQRISRFVGCLAAGKASELGEDFLGCAVELPVNAGVAQDCLHILAGFG